MEPPQVSQVPTSVLPGQTCLTVTCLACEPLREALQGGCPCPAAAGWAPSQLTAVLGCAGARGCPDLAPLGSPQPTLRCDTGAGEKCWVRNSQRAIILSQPLTCWWSGRNSRTVCTQLLCWGGSAAAGGTWALCSSAQGSRGRHQVCARNTCQGLIVTVLPWERAPLWQLGQESGSWAQGEGRGRVSLCLQVPEDRLW